MAIVYSEGMCTVCRSIELALKLVVVLPFSYSLQRPLRFFIKLQKFVPAPLSTFASRSPRYHLILGFQVLRLSILDGVHPILDYQLLVYAVTPQYNPLSFVFDSIVLQPSGATSFSPNNHQFPSFQRS